MLEMLRNELHLKNREHEDYLEKLHKDYEISMNENANLREAVEVIIILNINNNDNNNDNDTVIRIAIELTLLELVRLKVIVSENLLKMKRIDVQNLEIEVHIYHALYVL